MNNRPPSDVLELDGVRYRDVGAAGRDRSTFLLLHGLGGSLHQWHEIQRGVSESWRTVAVDIPGFGHEAKGRWSFTVDGAADRLSTFCNTLGLDNCTLVCHSVGSMVGGLLATKLPNTFANVVLVSGAQFRAAAIAQNPLRGLATPRLGLFVAAQFLSGMIPVPDWVRRLLGDSPLARKLLLWPFVAHPAELDGNSICKALIGSGSPAVFKILLTARSINYDRIMASIRQPVGLVWGSEDRLMNDYDVERMRSVVNVVREEKIQDCGHWPMVETPTQLIDFLKAFA